jgi:hypothetical protein
MELFLLSFLVITVSVAGLALGVIVRKRPIRAGCGQYSGSDVKHGGCEVCAGAGRSERGLATGERPVGTIAFE